MEITKELLESFSKPVLLGLFPSLEIKNSEPKPFVVESILTGSPVDSEKQAFKNIVNERTQNERAEAERSPEVSRVTKTELNQFSKHELKNYFKSVDIDPNDRSIKKADILDDIMRADLPDEEVEAFKAVCIKVDKNAEYIVLHQIKEDGKVFKRGAKYSGEKAGRYLKSGQIRKRDR